VSKAVSNLLFYVTFSANFFLYCISGARFRTTLRSVLGRWLCCETDSDRPSLPASSRKSWTETKQHSVYWRRQQRGMMTSQRTTLSSSLNCAAAAAVPTSAADAQLKPVGGSADMLVQPEGDDTSTTVTAFVDRKPEVVETAAADNEACTAVDGSAADIPPKDGEAVDTGEAEVTVKEVV